MDEQITPQEKRHQTLVAKYGSVEAYEAVRRGWQSKGGKRSVELGKTPIQSMTKEQLSEAGKRGHAAMLKKLTKGADGGDGS